MKIKILYEDKYIIVCDKPVGVSSQHSEGGVESLPEALSEYRREKGEDGYIGVVHRLDAVTGGAILYAKRRDVCGALSSCEYKKEYLAAVGGVPEKAEGTMTDWLYHDSRKNKSFVVSGERKGAKYAELKYRILETVDGVSLVKVQLVTGRTHQIRVQFASRKMPLLGDGKYGSREKMCGVALHACGLHFLHPVSGKPIDVQTMPDRDNFPWNLFFFDGNA